jgi:hypothetical protein
MNKKKEATLLATAFNEVNGFSPLMAEDNHCIS